MYARKSLGIIAEYTKQRISIFDPDTLEVLQQLPIGEVVNDVVITSDCTRAFVSAFEVNTMFQIDLCAVPGCILGSAVAPTTRLDDVALTPDDRYVLSVDGESQFMDISSYLVRKNAFVSALPSRAQAVAISPKSPKLVLTAEFFNSVVRRFVIHSDGSLEDSGQTFPVGSNPNNINFSPDGRFAFVAAYGDDSINVLSTLIPENVVLLGSAPSSVGPQCLAVTRDGRHVFALTNSNVDIYAFDPVAGSLTLRRSFAHGLNIRKFYGVDQIALDACDRKLFISARGQLAVFTTYGLPLGNVVGAEGPGGIAICRKRG